jgi:hypothetical protein
MREIFLKSYTLTANWQKLADTRTVLTATIVTNPANAGLMQIRVDGGTEANWPKGVSNAFLNIDISRIEVKGTVNDSVLVAGTSSE